MSGLRESQPESFLRRAIALARRGVEVGDGGPFGAVVVKDGTVLGEGWNRVVATNDPTAHGEIAAIRDACRRLNTFDLTGCELYTTGQPCPMCLGAIYWARIERVYYGFSAADAAAIGFDDHAFYEQLALPSNRRRVPEVQLLADEALEVARMYGAYPNRVRY